MSRIKEQRTELTITTKGRDRDKEKERVKHVQGTGSPNLYLIILIHLKIFRKKSIPETVNYVVLIFLHPPYLRIPAKSSTKWVQ
jgi:hypothetical protein